MNARHVKTPLTAAAALAVWSSFAGVPLSWTVETTRTDPAFLTAYQGETLSLEAEMMNGGKPLDVTGAASLYWQTNGMGTAYWQAPAAASSNRFSATWSPTNDVGARVYNCFIGAPGSIFRAAFQLRLRPSPGARPNVLPLPTPVIDFATVTVLNPPWPTNAADKAYVDAATNATLAAANAYTDEHGGGGVDTNTVREIVKPMIGAAIETNATVKALTSSVDALATATNNLTSSVTRLESSKADKADTYTKQQTADIAAAKANAAIAAAGLNRAVLTNEEGFVEGEFSVSGNIYANNGLVVSDHGVLVNDGTGGYSVQYDADGVWYAPSGEFWYHPWYRPDGWRSDSDHFYATVGDIDDATNGLAKSQKWPLSSVTNAQGHAVSAADVGAFSTNNPPPYIESGSMRIYGNCSVYSNQAVSAWVPSSTIPYPWRLDDYSEYFVLYDTSTEPGTSVGLYIRSSDNPDILMLQQGTAGWYTPESFEFKPVGDSYVKIGDVALRDFASLSAMLADANSNPDADCACICTNLCKLISPKMDEKPHLAYIDGELHVITITETED